MFCKTANSVQKLCTCKVFFFYVPKTFLTIINCLCPGSGFSIEPHRFYTIFSGKPRVASAPGAAKNSLEHPNTLSFPKKSSGHQLVMYFVYKKNMKLRKGV